MLSCVMAYRGTYPDKVIVSTPICRPTMFQRYSHTSSMGKFVLTCPHSEHGTAQRSFLLNKDDEVRQFLCYHSTCLLKVK